MHIYTKQYNKTLYGNAYSKYMYNTWERERERERESERERERERKYIYKKKMCIYQQNSQVALWTLRSTGSTVGSKQT